MITLIEPTPYSSYGKIMGLAYGSIWIDVKRPDSSARKKEFSFRGCQKSFISAQTFHFPELTFIDEEIISPFVHVADEIHLVRPTGTAFIRLARFKKKLLITLARQFS